LEDARFGQFKIERENWSRSQVLEYPATVQAAYEAACTWRFQADASTVTTALALKADSSAVSTVATALAQEVTDRTNAVALKLATSVYDARVVNEAVFFDSVANSIVLQDANGTELNYVALGLVPA
jgi:hypothetical protein